MAINLIENKNLLKPTRFLLDARSGKKKSSLIFRPRVVLFNKKKKKNHQDQ